VSPEIQGRGVRVPKRSRSCDGALRRSSLRPILAAVVVVAACEPSADRNEFDDFFVELQRIQLEELPDDPIVGIHHVSRRPDGGFAVADQRAGRVRLYDAAGRLEEVLGQRGDGPGEFRSPTGAIELPSGRVVVTEGSDPALTIFTPDREVRLGRVPGHYAFWVDRVGDDIVVGLGSRGDRFAVLTESGATMNTFGGVDREVNEVPFWIFFARDRAAVIGDRIAINTSFYPTVRIFDVAGDSLDTIGSPPPVWISAEAPPIDQLSGPGDRERIEEWSRGFTVVRALATVADTLLVVQYGRHDPIEGDPYHVRPGVVDVYTVEGRKLAEAVDPGRSVVGGGRELLVLSAEPPEPWTISVYGWRDR